MFLAVYVGAMFTPGLLDDADSTHAEAAREMVVTGDYVTLHVNGVRYLEKAPLPYWLVAFSYKILGVNEFSTRLPMVLSVMLLGVLAFCWGRRAFGERTGIYAGLFVYTCAGVFLFTRILIPEVLLSLLIASALYFFLTASRTASRTLAMVRSLRNDGVGRPHQGADRPGVSLRRGIFLFAGDWRMAPLAGVPADFRAWRYFWRSPRRGTFSRACAIRARPSITASSGFIS